MSTIRHSQYHLPAIGKKIAYKANREGVAARFADPAVQKSLAVDLALITSYAERLRDVALTIVTTANHHDANTRYLLPTGPVSARFSASCCSTTSTRSTASPGYKMSSPLAAWGNVARHRQANAGDLRGHNRNAHLTGAFLKLPCCSSETIQQRSNTSPAWRKNMTKARPLPSLAQQLARAVYYITGCEF